MRKSPREVVSAADRTATFFETISLAIVILGFIVAVIQAFSSASFRDDVGRFHWEDDALMIGTLAFTEFFLGSCLLAAFFRFLTHTLDLLQLGIHPETIASAPKEQESISPGDWSSRVQSLFKDIIEDVPITQQEVATTPYQIPEGVQPSHSCPSCSTLVVLDKADTKSSFITCPACGVAIGRSLWENTIRK